MGWIRQQAETPVLIQPFLYSAYRSRQAVLAGNLLTDQIRPIYFKYLAAFGSVLISSIYGVVDAAMVGQYQGPTDKAATLAVVAPVWNIIYSLGLLTSIGGGVWRSLDAGSRTGSQWIRPHLHNAHGQHPEHRRRYGISFLLLPFNIFSTYYFQAMMKPSTAFVVSVSRGAVISGILIYLLPVIAGASGIWFAMPITELVVAVFMAVMMRRCQKQPIR